MNDTLILVKEVINYNQSNHSELLIPSFVILAVLGLSLIGWGIWNWRKKKYKDDSV